MAPHPSISQFRKGNTAHPEEPVAHGLYWYNLEATCGGGAGRGRLLDRPDNLEQIGIPEGDVPEDQSVQPMDQENQGQDVEVPRSQYVSGGTICWESEIVVDNQVVPWNEQDTLVWEQNFLSRCQNAWLNPLVQRTEQIGEMAAENHKILEQKVREKTLNGTICVDRCWKKFRKWKTPHRALANSCHSRCNKPCSRVPGCQNRCPRWKVNITP